MDSLFCLKLYFLFDLDPTRIQSSSKEPVTSQKHQSASSKGTSAHSSAPIPPPIARDVVSDEVDVGGK
jgi:hypothetical protein